MRLSLSASSLPRAEKCAASATLPQFGTFRESSERGRLLHLGKELEQPDGAEIAYALNVLTGEARDLGHIKDRAYPDLGKGWLTGTTDRRTVEADRVVIRDYKSGVGFHVAPPAENLQLAFYAVAAARAHSKANARVEIEYLDQERVVGADLDVLDLAAAFARIRAVWEAASWREPRIVTGDHCWGCPCIARCPAQTKLALAVASGAAAKELPVLELTPVAVAQGWQKLQAFKKLLGEVERVYRAYAAGEPVPLGNGRLLGRVSKKREELDGQIAARALRELHGPEFAAEACEIKVTKAAIEEAVEKVLKPKRGEKAKAVRGALDALAAAGAITVKWSTTVEEYEAEEAHT